MGKEGETPALHLGLGKYVDKKLRKHVLSPKWLWTQHWRLLEGNWQVTCQLKMKVLNPGFRKHVDGANTNLH